MEKKKAFKVIIMIIALSSVQIVTKAQTVGIKFDNQLSWREIKSKAKTEHKFIFVDCYATWCGPCKFMADSIFTLKAVGEYMNSRFISVAVQMDKTLHDPETVKRWYKDGNEFQKEFVINSFPTYLIFSPDGKPIHRIDGATGSKGQTFINNVANAFIAERQYFPNNSIDMKLINFHKNDSIFFVKAIDTALSKYNYTKASLLVDYYLDCLKNPFLKSNLRILEKGVHFAPNSKTFHFLLENKEKIHAIEGNKSELDNIIRSRITTDALYPLLINSADYVDWEMIILKLKAKYPDYAERVVAEARPRYYIERNENEEYGKYLVAYTNTYKDEMIDYNINNNAYNIFLNCNNKETLTSAAQWSKSLVDKDTHAGILDDGHIDTYANLIYKLGDKENALMWERKALEIASDINNYGRYKMKSDKEEALKRHVSGIKTTITKFEKGEKTWN